MYFFFFYFFKKKRKYLSCHIIARSKEILHTKDSFMEVCFKNWLRFVRISLRQMKWVKFRANWYLLDKYSRITTDSPDMIYVKKNQILSDFYCFSINNKCVTQMWHNTVLYCHVIKCCSYIALMIAFVSSKRDVDDRRFNR